MATKVIRGTSIPKSELTSYGVGLMRLKEIGVPSTDFKRKDIEFIGQCSINRKKVIVGKVDKTWTVLGREKELERESGARYGGPQFIAHFAIKGKRSVCIFRDPNRDRSKPLHLMNANEVFAAGKGSKPCRRKAPKARLRTRIAYSEKMEKFPKLQTSCIL